MENSRIKPSNADKALEVFNPKDYTMAGATERDVLVYKEMFDLLDIDDNGMLTPMEVRNLMLHYGYNPKKQVVYQMVSDLDTDESGGIDFFEFMKMMTAKLSDADLDEDLAKVYYMYDTDRKGYITFQDLVDVTRELKEDVKEDELREIMQKVDPQNKDRITYQGWMKFMKKKDFSSLGSLKI